MVKRRYTSEEIYEMKTQIFEDNIAERAKFIKIAAWIEGKARIRADVDFSDFSPCPDNPHIPYYFISIPMTQYDNPSDWVLDGVNGDTKCKPPIVGISGSTPGWMLNENIPDVGKVCVYICVIENGI